MRRHAATSNQSSIDAVTTTLYLHKHISQTNTLLAPSKRASTAAQTGGRPQSRAAPSHLRPRLTPNSILNRCCSTSTLCLDKHNRTRPCAVKTTRLNRRRAAQTGGRPQSRAAPSHHGPRLTPNSILNRCCSTSTLCLDKHNQTRPCAVKTTRLNRRRAAQTGGRVTTESSAGAAFSSARREGSCLAASPRGAVRTGLPASNHSERLAVGSLLKRRRRRPCAFSSFRLTCG